MRRFLLHKTVDLAGLFMNQTKQGHPLRHAANLRIRHVDTGRGGSTADLILPQFHPWHLAVFGNQRSE